MRTKLLTMLTVLLALFSTSLKAQETTYYWYLGWDTEDWWNNLDKLTSTDNFNVTYTNEMPNTYNATNGEAYALKGTREDNYLALVIPADWPLPTLYASGKDGTYGIGSDSKSVTIDGVEYKLYSSYGTTSDPYCYINEVIYTPEHYWYVGWTQPTSLEELKTLATTADGSMSLGGAVGELYGEKLLTNSPEIGPMLPPAPCYVVIPVGYDIYDTTLPNNPITNSSFTKVTDVTIANHDVYVFLWNDVTVSGLEIYMDAERPKYYWYLGWDNEDWWSNLDKLTSTEDFNVTYTNEMPNSYNTTDGGLYALKGTREDNYWVLVIPADWPLPTLYNLTKEMDFELDPNGQLVTINGVEYKLYSSGATTSNPYCYINPGEPSSVEPEPEPETKYYWYLGTEKPTDDAFIEANGTPINGPEDIPTLTWTSAEYIYFVYPKEFGKAVIVDDGGDEAGGKAVESLSTVNLTEYRGWRFNKDNQGIEYTVSFKEEEEEPAEPEPYVTEFEANGIHYIFLEKSVSNDELAAWVTSTNGWFPGEENTYSGDIVIPATVTYGGKEYSVMGICENAFKKCSINSLTLSEGVVYISPNAFEETHLGALYLPSTFRMWDNFFINEVNGYMLLLGCLGLETLVVSPEHPLYDSRDNCNAIIETATNTLIEGCKGTVIPSSVTTIGPTAFIGRDIVEFVIPEGVKEVKGRVFELCKNLQSVVFPTSVEVIKGNMLFQGCSSLTSVEIPQTTLIRSAEDYEDPFETPGAMVIPSSMFGECSSLKEFTIPENVTSIGSAAFFMCGNLEAITIPESVIAIGDLAFFDCNKMTEITLLGQTPPAVPVDAFNETQYEQITLNVPEGAEEAYKQHEVWGKFFKEEKEEPEGLSTSKYYRVKNVTTGLYLQVEGNNTNMKLQNKAEGLAMMQIFGLEDAGEGMYYIKAADADNRYYAHASGWNFNATTNADSKTPFTIALVEGEEGVYTLHQSVSEYQGLAGADSSEAGSPVYCNKGIDNNGKWAFEALTAEEQAAYVATLTAAAKPALEAAIAHAEGVVSARSTVLSADEVAAINAAVATAKAEKDNTADVGVLYALTDAINAAVNEAIYVWNLDELSNEVCYAVATEERGAWYSQSENLTGTTKAGVAADITDSKQQFAFVKSAATGACYLYSVSEEKFVKVEGSNTALTEAPVQTISFLAGTRSAKYPWVVALNAEDGQKQMGISNGYDPAIITFYNDLGDGGNTVRIEKVATFDATAALAAIEALETGIESPMLKAQGSQLIYDLMGRRVEKAEKGIYIVNGKKVVIK